MKRFWIAIAVAIVLVPVLGAVVWHFNPLCGEELISEKASPDGHYVAVWMERNCGATTPFVEHINLRDANRNFRPDFFDGTITQGEVYTRKDGSLQFDWIGNRLVIESSEGDKAVFRRANRWNDVSITYR